MRSTRTWSPMRRVLTIEAEGISKFWKMKVMTKRPMARTVQMEARDSSGVSVRSCSADSISVVSVATVSVKTVSQGAAISVALMETRDEVFEEMCAVEGVPYADVAVLRRGVTLSALGMALL